MSRLDRRRGWRLSALLALVLGLLAAIAPGSASADEGTFSYTQTIPVAPASTYAGSGGGDGWALAMTPKAVYNVFHHSSQLTVACHLQSDASSCWSPKTITDGNGNQFRVSGQPSLELDQQSGHLYVFANRSADSSAGVVCIDTKQPAEVANPFCGYDRLTPEGTANGSSAVSMGVRIGTRWFAFSYASGLSAGANNNVLLCYDLAEGAACAGQPFVVDLGGGTVSVPDAAFRVPALAAIGTKVVIPVSAGVERLACFDTSTNASCAGIGWPAAAPSNYSNDYGSPFPSLSAGGEVTGVCFRSSGTPCLDLDGAPAPTAAGLSSVISGGSPWNGPAVVKGPRVYLAAGGSDRVECFSFNTLGACENFPRALPGAGYVYTVNVDPARPECIWINADYGAAQLQNFDAYTGGSCGRGPIRVLASSIVVPTRECQPASYTSMQIMSPARESYDTGTIAFLDGDGKQIPGIADRPIGEAGLVSLAGLDLSTASGLPQFLITLEGASTTPERVVVELVWRGPISEDCVQPETNTREYQALGDSFSSGFGNAPFLAGTHQDAGSNDCQRSTTAYSSVVKSEFDLNLNFWACQGAETRDLYSGRTRDASWGEKPQLDRLSLSTGLVTFSIGGNDAHFATVIRDCIDGYELLPFNSCHGDDRIENPVNEAIARLDNRTSTPTDIYPYDKIFKDVRARAPFSDRVVVGYPDLFRSDGGDRTFLPGGRCEGIKKVDQRWMVERIHELNGIIKATALRNGFRYADPSEFATGGHELCGDNDEWIGGVLADNRFHPTVAGQASLGRAVVAALKAPDAEGDTFEVGPAETVISSFDIAPGQKLVSIVCQWPGSDIPLTLVSPPGGRYTRSAPGAGVVHSNGPTWEQYEIPTPEAGTWKFELYGADVDPEGEPAQVLVSQEPFPNQQPVANISYRDNGDGTLTFSSAGSSDPDGSVERRQWYVSTEDSEISSLGETVTVPIGNGGKNVSLAVTDDEGATGFAELVLQAIAAPPSTPVVTQPTGQVVQSSADLLPPRISGMRLEKAVKKGTGTKWASTTSLSGKVRLRLKVSEAAQVVVTLRAKAEPAKARRVKASVKRAGVLKLALRQAVARLADGKVKIQVVVVDRAGNRTTRMITARK